MKRLVLPIALAFALAGCDAPEPGPDADGAPVGEAAPPPRGSTTAPPPVAMPPPPGIEGGNVGDEQDDADAAIIPERYRGEWNSDPAACGTGNSDSRLVVGEDTIRFYESSGPVRSARMDGNELVVVVRLTGEGETRDATYRFRVSADGGTLTDAGSGLARQRCR